MRRINLCAVSALAILCLAADSPGAPLSDWKWLYPKVQGNTLNDVDLLLPTFAVAVGDLGSVIETTDQGATWHALPAIQGLPTLNAVSAVNAETWVVVCNGGLVLRTVDGGASWYPRTSGTLNDLLDVDFRGGVSGLAVGTNGTILRSDDGGSTWSPQNSGTSSTLFAVRVIQAGIATVVGAGGTILRTGDLGANWEPQTSGTTMDLRDVDFYGTNPGMAVGGANFALVTEDGGAHWSPTASLPLGSVAAHAVNVTGFPHAVIVGHMAGDDLFPCIIRTTDGGVSWSGGYEYNSSGLLDVAMFTSDEGVAVGQVGAIRRTTDGGVTWPWVGGGSRGFTMQTVDFLDPMHGAAVSSDRSEGDTRVYTTSDGGITWDVRSIRYWAYCDAEYADANTLYVVGHGWWWLEEGGWIWRSVNGGPLEQIFGACTSLCGPPYLGSFYAVDFAGPDAGVAVGNGEGLVVIRAGHPEWVSMLMFGEYGVDLRAVSVPTPQVAYAVGPNGFILKGDLVSGVWTQLTSGTLTSLSDVCFTDAMTGVVVGDGTIMRTTDGGNTWAPPESGTTHALNSVSFIDANNGLAVTGEALILKTRNGGDTWVAEDMPFPITRVDFIDPVTTVAVGGGENIIVHRDGPVPVFFQDISVRAEPFSVELGWVVIADEAIRGFEVYRRDGDGDEIALTHDLLAPTASSFVDRRVTPGSRYEYSVVALDESGSMIRSRPVWATVPDVGVTLHQNTPNPFNPATHIRFTLPARMHVTLSIFDVSGRRIATLVDGVRAAGVNDVVWEGRNSNGDPAPSGIYFYELKTPSAVATRKMLLLK